MRQKTTATLLGVAVFGRRVLHSSFRLWSGPKLFRYLVGESRGAVSGSPHKQMLSSCEMDRRREQLNQILWRAYREKLAARNQRHAPLARPVWAFPTVTA